MFLGAAFSLEGSPIRLPRRQGTGLRVPKPMGGGNNKSALKACATQRSFTM
jgi:hypothetical protein